MDSNEYQSKEMSPSNDKKVTLRPRKSATTSTTTTKKKRTTSTTFNKKKYKEFDEKLCMLLKDQMIDERFGKDILSLLCDVIKFDPPTEMVRTKSSQKSYGIGHIMSKMSTFSFEF